MAWFKAGSSRKPRRQSRTLPLQGSGNDEGHFYRCWNCGFRCDTRRDRLGDGQSVSGNSAVEYVTKNDLGAKLDGKPESAMIVMECLSFNHQAILGPGGVKHDMKPVVGSGCPSCGTPNWRGDY